MSGQRWISPAHVRGRRPAGPSRAPGNDGLTAPPPSVSPNRDPEPERTPGPHDVVEHPLLLVDQNRPDRFRPRVWDVLPVEPAILVMKPDNFFMGMESLTMEDQMIAKVFIKVKAEEKAAFISKIQGIWKDLYGSDPFDYSYIEDQIAQEYVQANSLSTLVTMAAIVALIIAGMGLFAMASLAISSRMKEIGIRRVMGATTGEISLLFNKQFIRITLIGIAISIPASYYLMNLWLEDFAVKTNIGVGVFLIALLVGVLFSVAIVSFETVKASWLNPTKLLRSE